MRLVDIAGQRFGKLVVVEYAGQSTWLCRCDCGNEKIAKGNELKDGRTKSCCCLRRKEEASFNILYRGYKQNAKKRGLPFYITKEEFKVLTKQNCTYCGIEPAYIKKTKSNNGDYIYNGIDRINSSFGYSIDNCVPCCWTCNRAKMSETQEDFKSWIEQVYNNWIKGDNNE